MAAPQRDLAVWFGLALIGLVILAFLALTSCRPDFFRGIALTF